jgi:hypothetical protein
VAPCVVRKRPLFFGGKPSVPESGELLPENTVAVEQPRSLLVSGKRKHDVLAAPIRFSGRQSLPVQHFRDDDEVAVKKELGHENEIT